jgi:hypothetical protein
MRGACRQIYCGCSGLVGPDAIAAIICGCSGVVGPDACAIAIASGCSGLFGPDVLALALPLDFLVLVRRAIYLLSFISQII